MDGVLYLYLAGEGSNGWTEAAKRASERARERAELGNAWNGEEESTRQRSEGRAEGRAEHSLRALRLYRPFSPPPLACAFSRAL